ncbi:MAG: hypothetical protein KBC06_01780 [Candidatus Pacebacteria bacterium]|nr:hypothetical protein [Candidatus Paceibacterota bacterium]
MNMENTLNKALCDARCTPTPNLADNVWHVVVARNKRIANIKLGGFGVLACASLLVLVSIVSISIMTVFLLIVFIFLLLIKKLRTLLQAFGLLNKRYRKNVLK